MSTTKRGHKGYLFLGVLCLFVTVIIGRFTYLAKSSAQNDYRFPRETPRSLDPCENHSNCVSSFSNKNEKSYISSLKINNFDMDRFVLKMRKDKVIYTYKKPYMVLFMTTSVFKFYDQVEILYKEDEVFFRSTSQVGYYDFGANRKRIEYLKSTIISSSD